MEDYATRARYWRNMARDAANLAEKMATVDAKRLLVSLAKDFLQMAETLESRVPQTPSRPS